MATSLAFTARRGEPVLVTPARPTPHELKRLSDIDDQEGLRFYRSIIYFYRSCPSRAGQDPARVIREALARALVYYYPMAGRLRELPGRKLVVDCTGEGVVFVEADASVTLQDFGDALSPPIPCAGELLCLPESNSAVVVNRPLLYVQVTRLQCGGFVFGTQTCHNLADAPGLTQFLNAVGELARGMEAPTVQPVWARELFDSRDPPRVVYRHPEYEPVADAANDKLSSSDKLVHRAFFFGREEIAALRRQVPPQLRSQCSRFLLVAAFMWRCRTIAVGYEPGDVVRFMFAMNARGKRDPPIPKGFYGNALTNGVASTTAGELCSNPLSYPIELIAAAKERIMKDDYIQSVADMLVRRGRPRFTTARAYLVTDLTKAELHRVELGWGRPVYGAPATVTLATFHMPTRNGRGEDGITVPMCLPSRAMARLAADIVGMLMSSTSCHDRSRATTAESGIPSKI